ncbi:bone morphogenetic protein 2-A-like [Saccostrea cucullata]|uniref:bone morphogenetic protein 2-A-like n=1 Tax=Saccostrea cuccullata TaxID=36930 RepID=UPI002ED1D22C
MKFYYDCTFPTVLITMVQLTTLVVAKPASVPTSVDSDQQIHLQRLELFKQKILDGLQYKSAPRVTAFNETIAEKRKLIQMYRNYMRKKDRKYHEESEPIPGTTKMYRYSIKPENKKAEKRRVRIFIQPDVTHSDDHMTEIAVSSAKLKLFKHSSLTSIPTTEVELNIFSNNQVLETLLESRTIDVSRDGWEIFDITKIVQDWIDDPELNNGVEIYADGLDTGQLVFPSLDFTEKKSSKFNTFTKDNIVVPILEIKTHERSILKRVKRRNNLERRDCVKGDGESRCCRFTTTIAFSDLHWDDWIIAPPEYEAHYCDGSCPDRFKMANTFAGIQARLHTLYPNKFPKPCCVPSKLSPLTILHKDSDGKYQFTDYPDMIVEDCKCA